MVRAFLLSLAQLGDRAVLGVLAKSLALTLAIFVAAGAMLWWGIGAALAGRAYGGAIAGTVAVVAVVLGGWLLFRAVAVFVLNLFGDEIVAAVERRHYPQALAAARQVGVGRSIRMGLASAGRAIGVNLLLLPLYLLLLATGVGTAALFFAANAWLLGRDLEDMVAARHLPTGAMRGWRKATGGRRLLLGLAGTGLFVVPGVNLVAPVIAAAMATHLFHGVRR